MLGLKSAVLRDLSLTLPSPNSTPENLSFFYYYTFLNKYANIYLSMRKQNWIYFPPFPLKIKPLFHSV